MQTSIQLRKLTIITIFMLAICLFTTACGEKTYTDYYSTLSEYVINNGKETTDGVYTMNVNDGQYSFFIANYDNSEDKCIKIMFIDDYPNPTTISQENVLIRLDPQNNQESKIWYSLVYTGPYGGENTIYGYVKNAELTDDEGVMVTDKKMDASLKNNPIAGTGDDRFMANSRVHWALQYLESFLEDNNIDVTMADLGFTKFAEN